MANNFKPDPISSISTPPPTTTTLVDESTMAKPTINHPAPAPPLISDHNSNIISSSDQDQDQDHQKWGTHVMGAPAPPSAHPQNQKAALWSPAAAASTSPPPPPNTTSTTQPYIVQYSPSMVAAGSGTAKRASPPPGAAGQGGSSHHVFESCIDKFNKWSKKTETLASNIWVNLRTSSSVGEAAWGKMSLTAKAMTEGGFQSLFKKIFQVEADHSEELRRTFACYLSTTTGPVAGTIYLSNLRVCFCSDRPLTFTAPSGQQAWTYYKVVIPLGRIINGSINPVISGKQSSVQNNIELEDNQAAGSSREFKYIEIVTVDGHSFWFMGFVNYEKAVNHLLQTLSNFASATTAASSGTTVPDYSEKPSDDQQHHVATTHQDQ